MTSFEKVVAFNKMMGRGNGLGMNEEEYWETVENQWDMIVEEYLEACDEMLAKDPVALAKELCDLLVVTYGQLYVMGVDADKMMSDICDNNDTKFVNTVNLASTVAHYDEMGISVYSECVGEDKWAVKLVEDCEKGPKGKLMKPVDYKKFELEYLNDYALSGQIS